jgi:preprotein translocase subunit SecB
MSETESAAGAGAGEGQQAPQPQLTLQKIYLKDMSYESPNAPDVFRRQWKPKIKLDLNSRFSRMEEDDLYEVVLTLSIEAKGEDDKVGFIVELQQAGIFTIVGLDDAQLQHTLASYCPNVLFPYARETIDSLVTRGSFPALMLAPVNFDAIYAEALRRRAEQQGAAAPAGDAPAADGDESVQH